MRTLCGTILAAATVFAATSAYAWGSGHDTVARETLKHLPGEWGERLRLGEGGKRFLSAAHAPKDCGGQSPAVAVFWREAVRFCK